jgi:periplasmic protein TonB
MSAAAMPPSNTTSSPYPPTDGLQALRAVTSIAPPKQRHAAARFFLVALCHVAVVVFVAQQMSSGYSLPVLRANVLELQEVAVLADTLKPTPLKVAATRQSLPASPTPTRLATASPPDMAAPALNTSTTVAVELVAQSNAAAAPITEPTAPALPQPLAAPAKPTTSAPKVELPSASADYLNNPPPTYPPASKRMRETGSVLLHVWVTADGRADRVELRQSSGFDRLDEAAMAAVRQWRFVPGHRDGVAAAMWVNVPVSFELR